MPRNTLKKLGLTDNEVQVYLTTLSLGQALVSTIANKCGIKRTSCYAVIDKLSERGFLTSFTQKGTKYYCAVDPEVLIERSKQKVAEAQQVYREFENALPLLNSLKEENKNIASLQFFEGEAGLMNIVDILTSSPGEILETASGGAQYNKLCFETYIKKAKENNIPIKVIETNTDLKQIHDQIKFSQSTHPLEEMRCISNPLYKPLVNTRVKGDKVFLSSHYDDEMIGIAIESKKIAEHLKNQFFFLWDIAEPI